ncbi:MAG: hypothetical protein A3F31_03585 [Candidatus Levybacteria bacterium RIFCSPHIGHO2_12_FULL_38_12]|nr:MAG: hypothetical protein A3D75_01790 [Candidatus Levybacteria bacterium RIFCSPHIGHO2_02_FULL_37_18]OGH23113.1 MAG: hypothetical protein A3F31_03585 [Candidatus Levybacteria bacterium RIFCSPHIGHO2_12_FULL_38_12]OGH34567.1 MAG: hypothetical protein A3A47_00100 [Candidatus Levybacteria bacterium RIFCSPLOWO2_01_FULL_37_20]OGH43683.1 MAG: hypothetical protein A3J14_03755 [Candidatus Levybacteria bacterium RIFCSPLOWO2_02_FULL_37_18]
MKVAIICSNAVKISQSAKRGTEIFDYVLIDTITRMDKSIDITAFASGNSDLPVSIQSVAHHSSSEDVSILKSDKHVIFELALISKAFFMQDTFDLYHCNIGDGDLILPFAPFIKKPIVITLHYTQNTEYVKKYFSLFNNLKNVFFVSISNTQRKFFPKLNYIDTIYHGIETDIFTFDQFGGEKMMWAGRGIPNKGLEDVFEIAKKLKRKVNVSVLRKKESIHWLNKLLSDHQGLILAKDVTIEFERDRTKLIKHFQGSRLFLFPLQWEEPFGLVLIEAMSCGTPVIAYAKGSIPEIIKDGETGFIVNSSDNDIRGDFIIKKTGIEGLLEAVERMYSLPEDEYLAIRKKCRERVETHFTIEKMVENYIKAYKTVIAINRS